MAAGGWRLAARSRSGARGRRLRHAGGRTGQIANRTPVAQAGQKSEKEWRMSRAHTRERLAVGPPRPRTAERLVGAAERALRDDKKMMLMLLPAAARGQVEHVQITNGTGLYCRGCAVLVEAVHEQLMATRLAETRVPVACVGKVRATRTSLALDTS